MFNGKMSVGEIEDFPFYIFILLFYFVISAINKNNLKQNKVVNTVVDS